MNKILYILLLTFSCLCYSDTKISVHDGEINISDECTYYIPDIQSAGFSCADNLYRISFSEHSKIAASHERMIKRNASEKLLPENLDTAIKKKIGEYTHYYYAMSSTEVDFLFYNYYICDYDLCINVGSTQKHSIRTVLNQLKIELIDNENL